MSQNINEHIKAQNIFKNSQNAYNDKTEGVLKPPREDDDETKDSRENFAKKDIEYPSLELIICRRGIVKPDAKEKDGGKLEEVIAFIDGAQGNKPCLTIRLDNLKKGEYFILYRPDFKPTYLVRRLNIVFYSQFQPIRTEQEVKLLNLERK